MLDEVSPWSGSCCSLQSGDNFQSLLSFTVWFLLAYTIHLLLDPTNSHSWILKTNKTKKKHSSTSSSLLCLPFTTLSGHVCSKLFLSCCPVLLTDLVLLCLCFPFQTVWFDLHQRLTDTDGTASAVSRRKTNKSIEFNAEPQESHQPVWRRNWRL